MIEIIPAVLPKSLSELQVGLERVQGLAPLVQVDLVGTNVLAGEEEMPLWQEFDFEFDIMLPNPAEEVEQCVALGASRIVVHASAESALQALTLLQDKRTGEFPIAVGVALGATDSLEALEPFTGLYDYVQVMGIAQVGAQGQPPAPEALELVRALRAAFPDLVIQVDGAVAPRVREFAEAGANRLVVGSALMSTENPSEVYGQLFAEANK